MSEYITLIGADGVERAGRSMRGAADDMTNAVSRFESALEQHRRYLDDWIARFEQAVEALIPEDQK